MHLRSSDAAFRDTPKAVDPDGVYQPVSFWHETVDLTPTAPLGSEIDCDVVVIGGGFTGLSTAYELKRADPELEVVLIERDVVGHGASGRNGGFIMPLLGWNLVTTAKKLGRERAADAYRVMYDAIAHTVSLIEDHQIDCDLEQTGYLLLSPSDSRIAHVREEAELGEQLGFGYRFLEGSALEEHIRSDAFRAGCYDPNAAVVNPAKLARGLKSLAESTGVRVYEQTALSDLEDGEVVRVRTPDGLIKARAGVLAVNAYGATLGFQAQRVLAVHTYIVMTEPLSDADLETIGWGEKRTSLETSRNFIHYFRLTADNRILFGGDDAKLFWGGQLRDHDDGCVEGLQNAFRRFFPTLDHIGFSHRWGGIVGVTIDMLPTFGVGGSARNIFHASGYSGHGVSLANYAGRILTPPIVSRLGRPVAHQAPAPVPFGRLPMPLGPQAIRFVGMQLYRLGLHAQDRWQKS